MSPYTMSLYRMSLYTKSRIRRTFERSKVIHVVFTLTVPLCKCNLMEIFKLWCNVSYMIPQCNKIFQEQKRPRRQYQYGRRGRRFFPSQR